MAWVARAAWLPFSCMRMHQAFAPRRVYFWRGGPAPITGAAAGAEQKVEPWRIVPSTLP